MIDDAMTNSAWLSPRALADATGVSTDSLRHYERLGLLRGTVRTRAGYRRYPPGSVEHVQIIQRALVIGFSLKELAAALTLRAQGGVPCQRVRKLVGERLAALEIRLAELTTLREEMRVLLRDWDARLAETQPGQRARLLDMLSTRPVLDRPVAARPRGSRNFPHRT